MGFTVGRGGGVSFLVIVTIYDFDCVLNLPDLMSSCFFLTSASVGPVPQPYNAWGPRLCCTVIGLSKQVRWPNGPQWKAPAEWESLWPMGARVGWSTSWLWDYRLIIWVTWTEIRNGIQRSRGNNFLVLKRLLKASCIQDWPADRTWWTDMVVHHLILIFIYVQRCFVCIQHVFQVPAKARKEP